MAKPVYKVIDDWGRVLIPRELRKRADMESGDIVKLTVTGGRLQITRVEIVEAGEQDPAAVEAFVNTAVKSLGKEKQVALASKLLLLAEEGEKDC